MPPDSTDLPYPIATTLLVVVLIGVALAFVVTGIGRERTRDWRGRLILALLFSIFPFLMCSLAVIVAAFGDDAPPLLDTIVSLTVLPPLVGLMLLGGLISYGYLFLAIASLFKHFCNAAKRWYTNDDSLGRDDIVNRG